MCAVCKAAFWSILEERLLWEQNTRKCWTRPYLSHMSLITVIHALRAVSKISVTSNITAVHWTVGNQEQNVINCDRWSRAYHRCAVPNPAVSLRRLESRRPFFPTAIMKLPLWS